MSTAVFTSFDQQVDSSGDPLNGGSVTVYQAGTTTPIQLYNDDDLAGGHETTNPITLLSDGRHAITYFSTQSYKVLIKDSGGSTIATIDNIDPGVPVGTGALPVANGGTGATTAVTALVNLGGATAAELADIAADVAALAGAAASTEKTHIATGTTAQRPGSPIEGDFRRNTTVPSWEGYNDAAAWETFRTDVNFLVATAAQQETATVATAFVAPSIQHRHPSAAKVWIHCDAAGTINTSYNMTSITDTGTGLVTFTIATDFSGTSYACVPGVEHNTNLAVKVLTSSQAAGSIELSSVTASTNVAADPSTYYAAMFGDQ